MDWTLQSWRGLNAEQQPPYEDQGALERALAQVRVLPPMVVYGEIEKLKHELSLAGLGRGFVLQGGHCAERFIDCHEGAIRNQLKILLQMSVILAYGARKPVVRIGRMAGQYAKPRSQATETVGGQELLSYRGDNVNAPEANADARRPDPARLVECYYRSAATLNFIRGMIDGGFADLHYPDRWNLSSIEQSANWPRYREIVERILDAIHFMESFGGVDPDSLGRIEFYTSHEGLLLGYEEALTQRDPRSERYYNLGAHMLWIGQRTRALDGAHVEYFRGIANPIGIKIGPDAAPEEILELCERLDPEREPGRLTLINRLGLARVEAQLPALLNAFKKAGRAVVWSCDPMHGNTRALADGRKTRDFADILEELKISFQLHREAQTPLGGVHFELTGEDVTECIGGAESLTGEDLARNYETNCDPRLNGSQSIEMALLIARLLQAADGR